MFSFMKKAGVVVGVGEEEDKERKRKEKKDRKDKLKRDRGLMSAEELLRMDEVRMDEVRRSVKIRGRRKEKEKLPSGITADYSASFFAELDRDAQLDRDANYSNYPLVAESEENNHIIMPETKTSSVVWRESLLQSDSSEASLNSLNNPNGLAKQPPNLPPLPPRPPKRGILKGPRLSNSSLLNNGHSSSDATDFVQNGQDLANNTIRNEVISYQNLPMRNGGSQDVVNGAQNFTKKVIHSPVDGSTRPTYYNNYGSPPPITVTSHDYNEQYKGNGTPCATSPSPSADTLTDTTSNSSFATPPFSMSPTGDADGFHQFSSYLDGMDLPLPEIVPAVLPAPRVLIIQRQKAPRSDFGFSLRRAMIVERYVADGVNGVNGVNSCDDEKDGVKMKAVIFAEPGTNGQGHETGLLPGDRLLEVNGVCVDDKSRDEIIEMIKGSHDHVTVKVQPVAELSEVWRRWAALVGAEEESSLQASQTPHITTNGQAKSEDESDPATCDDEGERLWLCHRAGFTATLRPADSAATAVPTAGDERRVGRTSVRLKHSGQDIEVEDDDLEKANPSQFDLVEDLASLRYLNESSALHTLRQRYGSNLVHTAAGHSLLLINPPAPLTIYSDKVAAMFKGCRWEDAPPHLYAAAQAAHRAMLSSRRDQALVFLGRSGSGKSGALRRCALYLAGQGVTSGSGNSASPWVGRVRAALLALTAAGCWSGGRSAAAQVMTLHYDQTGALAGAALHAHLLDLTRVPTKQSLDGAFDIFKWVIHGCDSATRRVLLLEGARAGGEEALGLALLCEALAELGVSERERLSLWRVLAAIWHLASAGAVKVSGRYQFAEPAAGARAAQLLGCCPEELARALFSGAIGAATAGARTPSPTDRGVEREISGNEALEGLVIGLYTEFFNCMVALINRCLTTNARTVSSLLLVDPPGLAGGNGGVAAAGLQQLAVNYLQERLQLLAHERAVLAPRAACRQEGLPEEDWITEVMNPGPMVELLDRTPQNTMLRTSQADLRDVDRKGLLWLLDEESMHPGASDTSFVERAASMWSGSPQQLMRRAPHPMHFVLHHMQGTYPVMYNASGWLKASRENPVSRNAIGLLQESSIEDVSRLFVWSRGLCGAGPDAQASLRRASSIRRTLTTGAVVVNRRSIVAQIQGGVETVLGALRRTRPRFVFCALPRKQSSSQAGADGNLDVPLLRSQFRGFQILEAARMYKQGFPDSLPFAEFARRFRLLASPHHDGGEGFAHHPSLASLPQDEQRRTVEEMLKTLDLDPSLYRIGLSQVLLRAGALLSLEARRDSLLRARIVSLQAACRGVLARRAAARLRVQHVAARCVQRNVRAFLAVRDWPWWRLLVRVAPLLAVNRTEDQLRSRTEELEALKMKTEKLELERANLKHENDKLENKLSEMTAELAVEQSAGSLAAERLGAETSERLRLERDILGLKSANTSLQQTSERLETELMYSRAETSASGGSAEGGSEEEGGDSGGKYKRRLQAALRELEAVRRQLRQQHEDDLEQLVNLKKQLEKKVADAYEEVNEQRQVGAQWKRKAQKAASDANDLRLLLDEQGARAALLEKRQRRADGEGQQLQEEVRREKALRERCQREADQLQQEKHLLEQNLADLRMELEMKEERLAEASKELQELAYGGKGEEEVGALRKTKHDLEAKCHDQEEELDEMAGQLQLLESHKVRLEMSLEQQRKAARLEAAQRDEEMEEVRAQAAKKVKGLESQLETEHNERSLLLRERHELERRLAALEESARAEAQERDVREARSRKDLKRARALARDAQAVLERREKEAPGKQQLRQLRDKLDDTEVALRTAVKARQAAEAEAADASAALEESVRGRREAEARAAQAQREGATTAAQLEEAEEEAAEVMKKYRACVQSLGEEQRAAREASARASSAEEEARVARERANELQARLSLLDLAHTQGQTAHTDKLELRSKELEARLELEQTARCRLEAQTTRAKEAAASSAQAAGAAQARELQQAEEMRKIMRQLRELREELSTVSVRMDEAVRARTEAEARLEAERAEGASARTELREARARIALLQQAISDELSPGDNSDSDNDSYSSDESIDTFLANHKISPVANSFTGNNSPKSTDGRQSRSSVSSSKQLSPTKESFA